MSIFDSNLDMIHRMADNAFKYACTQGGGFAMTMATDVHSGESLLVVTVVGEKAQKLYNDLKSLQVPPQEPLSN